MYILYNQSKCVCVSVCVSFSLSLFFLKKHTIMNFYLIKVDLVSSFYSLDRYLIPKDTQIRWITIVSWFLLFDYTTIKNNHNLNTWPPPPLKKPTQDYTNILGGFQFYTISKLGINLAKMRSQIRNLSINGNLWIYLNLLKQSTIIERRMVSVEN